MDRKLVEKIVQGAPKANMHTDVIKLHTENIGNTEVGTRYLVETKDGKRDLCEVRFQTGPVGEVGLNGIFMEDLLTMVQDRLQAFQQGDYACESNQIALEHINAAMDALDSRTRDRIERKVLGTYEK